MINYAVLKIKKDVIKNQLVVRTFSITCMDIFVASMVFFSI